MADTPVAFQRCIDPACGAEYPVTDVRIGCEACGSLLDVAYRWPGTTPRSFDFFERRGATFGDRGPTGAVGDDGSASEAALDFSGVWRFRELLPFWMDAAGGAGDIVTVGEGRTSLQRADRLGREIGIDPDAGGRLMLQYEGFNPTGSFKDNGMTAAFTHARMVGARRVACASTGNTSASMAAYAALAGMSALVFVGEGKIAAGKLSQALDYGARTLQVAGDFDACMGRLRELVVGRPELGVYLMNSLNPFRLEGQKAVMYRVLEGLDWRVPDWVVVPGGNLGNSSAFGKAFAELRGLGLIDRVPRLAVVNAAGARTLDRVVNDLGVRWDGGRYDRSAVEAELSRMEAAGERARTVASAIEINRPVNLAKCLRALEVMDGVVLSAADEDILDHKALVGRWGFGCEPASAASVCGARRLIERGVIGADQVVACVLTGHQLKDPDATVGYHSGGGARSNAPVPVADDLEAIIAAIEG